MLEFSVSNQLLSRLDAAKVVADSENYLECGFSFSRDWDGTVAVATFGHRKVAEPISVRIVDGKCRVPHEVIKTHGFQLSVYGTVETQEGTVCHIPTNVVTVEVENSGPGQDLGPTEPTESMYTTLMTAIAAGEAAATEAKVSARASAEMANGARTGAQASQNAAQEAAANSAISAGASAKDAMASRVICEKVSPLEERMRALLRIVSSYATGGDIDWPVRVVSNIPWQDGVFQMDYLYLNPGKRYRVRVDDVWYETVPQWELEKECETEEDEQTSTGGESTGGTPVVKPRLRYTLLKDVIKLEAGPVTVEEILVNKEAGETLIAKLLTTDTAVQEVEIRTVGSRNAKYYYEQALQAAERAEAAADRIEAAAGTAQT